MAEDDSPGEPEPPTSSADPKGQSTSAVESKSLDDALKAQEIREKTLENDLLEARVKRYKALSIMRNTAFGGGMLMFALGGVDMAVDAFTAAEYAFGVVGTALTTLGVAGRSGPPKGQS